MAGFDVGRFYELTTSTNGNWIVGFIGVVVAGWVTNSYVRKSEERKMVAAENPPTVIPADQASALKITTTSSATSG